MAVAITKVSKIIVKNYSIVNKPEYYYSNCVIEALRAKWRNPCVKWIWFPRQYTRWRWFHVMWQDGSYVYHFQCAVKGDLPWWKRFCFKGYLKRYRLDTYQEMLERKKERYTKQFGQTTYQQYQSKTG